MTMYNNGGAMKKDKDAEFARIWEEAVNAGMQAGTGNTPNPMIVEEHTNPLNDNSPVKQSWFVSEGACGFAWIVVYPGTSSFAKWAAKNRGASKNYPSGMMVKWVSEFNQSVNRKEAYASAFAQVLQKYGIKAYSQSRLD
jgi:hypothetical protein